MITSTQASQYLDSTLGVSVPVFLIDAALEKIEAAEPAMIAAGYSESDQIMIQCMAVAIIAASGSPRRVTNQHAASGAARGFKYADGDLSALRRTLAALDTSRTVAALVGPDPASATLFMII